MCESNSQWWNPNIPWWKLKNNIVFSFENSYTCDLCSDAFDDWFEYFNHRARNECYKLIGDKP